LIDGVWSFPQCSPPIPPACNFLPSRTPSRAAGVDLPNLSQGFAKQNEGHHVTRGQSQGVVAKKSTRWHLIDEAGLFAQAARQQRRRGTSELVDLVATG
ncbi:MAG: hypothetical protein ACKPKO_19570, partial [Candidatus Fonsibacter sp.]